MARQAPASTVLEVRDLRVTFATPDGIVEAVRGVSFDLGRGQTVGIVGESGSGKSVATQAMVGLVRGAHVSGQARFEGRDLLSLPPAALRAVRGPGIAMVFQSPMSSLHPLHTIGWQIEEMIRAHEPVGRREARGRAVELLRRVGIPRPERRVDDYPHQWSGGMLQRAMIAMAIALRPRVLVADEPTTALDVTVQAQILKLLRDLQADFGTAIILITHDLGVVAELAHEVLVMYAGRLVERAPAEALLRAPLHPYTRGLLRSRPRIDGPNGRLTPIPGQAPSLIHPPPGCAFHARCERAEPRCADTAPSFETWSDGSGRAVACWSPDEEAAP